MTKLQLLAFYALLTPAITLGPGGLLAAQPSSETNDLGEQGMVASALIGTDLKSSDGESAGRISDLIIDQNGKVEAVLVNIGGLLAMGEKRVAINWNAIKRSASPDDQDLRVDMTRDDLQSAPGYESLDQQRPNAPSDLRLE